MLQIFTIYDGNFKNYLVILLGGNRKFMILIYLGFMLQHNTIIYLTLASDR